MRGGFACGDATCDSGESCWDCAVDCGACDCPTPTEVVVYTQSAWTVLADAFDADPSPRADYWISLPAYSDHKLDPRAGGEPEGLRARSPRIHALAELHWSTWAAEPGAWYEKGVEFRRRMADAGYDVAAGDTWAINELPSSVRSDAGRLASAIHYAYDAGGGSAAGACSPSGAYTWCACEVSGASFNDGWGTFGSW